MDLRPDVVLRLRCLGHDRMLILLPGAAPWRFARSRWIHVISALVFWPEVVGLVLADVPDAKERRDVLSKQLPLGYACVISTRHEDLSGLRDHVSKHPKSVMKRREYRRCVRITRIRRTRSIHQRSGKWGVHAGRAEGRAKETAAGSAEGRREGRT